MWRGVCSVVASVLQVRDEVECKAVASTLDYVGVYVCLGCSPVARNLGRPWVEKCVKIGAKITPNCLLEASLDLFWKLWGPCGCPEVPQCSKMTKKGGACTFFRDPFWSMFGTFAQIDALFGALFLGLCLDLVWD